MFRSNPMEFVRAAGGVLWRQGPGGPRLALVHRPFHGDWSLPKGKLEAGESWQAAAVREVAEETGCHGRVTSFAGAKLLLQREVPKLVLYWHMRVVRDGAPDDEDEVDEVAWLSPGEALARLDSSSDRQLLARANLEVRERGPAATTARVIRRERLLDLLVLDGRSSEEELDPFLRLIERAVEAPGPARRPSATLRRTA